MSEFSGHQRNGPIPTVTVIIAAFNGAVVIAEQLEALCGETGGPPQQGRQTLQQPFEVIVADNGSTDATRSIAAQFEGRLAVRIIDASAARGQAFARNIGAAAAKADRLLFLDQDDVIAPGYVAAMTAALDEHPVVAASMRTDRLNTGWVGAARSVTQESALPVDFGVPWAYGCTLGFRRDVFEAVGGFDASLRPAGEDVDLCIRLARAGYAIGFVPTATVQYRFPSLLHGLFHQGRVYGLGHINVCVRHQQAVGVRDVFGWVKTAVAAATWCLPGRSMERRGQGAFALGRRIGLIEGTLRHVRHLHREPPKAGPSATESA